MMQLVSDFLISELLWPMTGGLWHMPIAMVSTVVIMRLLFRLHLIYSIIVSLSANIFSCLMYAFFVHALLYLHLIVGSAEAKVLGVAGASISYAFIQSLFQLLFFFLLSKVSTVSVRRLALAALIGNLIAALIVIRYS